MIDFKYFRRLLWFTISLGCTFGTAQEMMQNIQLNPGWNAVHLTISPNQTANALFSEWPVTSVGVYDAASFARTSQFTPDSTTEGLQSPAVRMWHRQLAGDSDLFALPANTVLLCFATNTFSSTIFGVPEALRYSWHPTAAGRVYNYIGISVAPDKSPTLAAYCSGLDLSVREANAIYGSSPQSAAFGPFNLTTAISAGMTLAMTAEKADNWSGVLYVAPQSGVAFGSESTLQALSIRNDSATARTARLSWLSGEAVNAADIPPRCEVLYRDTSGTAPETEWQTLPEQLSKRLQPGERWQLTLALDRTQFDGVSAGTRFGGLLRVEDSDGGSHFRTTVPLSAISDHGAAGARAWPAGLWVAEVKLDKVTQVVNDSKLVHDIPAGGTMKLRLPLHVDLDGNLKLLQRVVAAGIETESGTVATKLYTGNAEIPASANQALRISAVALPVDQPVINGSGAFGSRAEFDFTVAEHSVANPMRHALHPNHDGLKSDFQTPTPSGDDFENYVSKVKPELFSIANSITLLWDRLPAGAAAWNPQERLYGRVNWDFGGLRREGVLRAQGRFMMQRIIGESEIKDEE